MFCSTVIPTIGRSTLTRAVESVLNQTFTADDFEIIVVNDSGQPLLDEAWQRSKRVQIINTNRHNRSVARNAGATLAKGRYLHFLDDDDWMLPRAFESFWDLANNSQAAWLYGGFRVVDNTGKLIKEIYPEEVGNCYIQLMASEWLPLQASLIKSEVFFEVGGFASLPSLLGGYEDIDLSRQIAHGHEMARITSLVTTIRTGDESSTTDYTNMFNQNRQSREKALNTSGAFTRMATSAKSMTNASYWLGRIIYYYLASLQWNLQGKQLTIALSRGSYALVTCIIAGQHLLSTNFWRGALKPHINPVRLALEEADTTSYTRTTWRL
jgi:hypothetical protein